jgi:hypothetical protein
MPKFLHGRKNPLIVSVGEDLLAVETGQTSMRAW